MYSELSFHAPSAVVSSLVSSSTSSISTSPPSPSPVGELACSASALHSTSSVYSSASVVTNGCASFAEPGAMKATRRCTAIPAHVSAMRAPRGTSGGSSHISRLRIVSIASIALRCDATGIGSVEGVSVSFFCTRFASLPMLTPSSEPPADE